jgi:hypothetical protein
VGYPHPTKKGMAETYDIIALEHIVRLEPADREAPAKPNGPPA